MQDSIVDILLVEDNPNDAELAIRALNKNNLANRTQWVKDGELALDYIFYRGEFAKRRHKLPSIVLPDLRPPKLDGIEVITAIRNHEEQKNIPVVVPTSSKEERDLVDTYKLGVNSFVTKPVALEEFVQTAVELGLYWVIVNRAPSEIRDG